MPTVLSPCPVIGKPSGGTDCIKLGEESVAEYEDELPRNKGEWVDKLIRDVYFGNGKPAYKERIAALEKTTEAITFYARWLLLTTAGLIVVGILNLILKH